MDQLLGYMRMSKIGAMAIPSINIFNTRSLDHEKEEEIFLNIYGMKPSNQVRL